MSWVWLLQCQVAFLHVSGIGGLNDRRKLWDVAVKAICWSLWLERNNRIFEDVTRELDFIWDRVKYWVALWVYDSKDFKELSFFDLCRDWSPWL